VIEAAGGVVWRTSPAGQLEVLIVHRPHRDDWSLPKGKRRRRESAPACALREVHEETGFRCVLGRELSPSCYVDRKGRVKRVRYWSMETSAGTFLPNDEVDEIRWVAVGSLHHVLSYDRDLVVVHSLDPLPVSVGVR
jgi:8-oxo-dGTP pyrophosphatase MutT (NUDIX family)